MTTNDSLFTNCTPNQPTDWAEKRRFFCAHPLSLRLWMALAFALLLALSTVPSAGAASLDRPAVEVPTREPPTGEPDVGEPYLVKDINVTVPGYLDPENLVDVDGTLYFIGGTSNSTGLWRSDGTPEGTILLKERPEYYWSITVVEANGVVFFPSQSELWKTDGTVEGTMLVKTLPETAEGPEFIRQLVNVNDTLYFEYGDNQLWKSDGTNEGTVLVKAGDPSESKPWLSGNNAYQPSGDKLFFEASTSVPGVELWFSDGTAEGTVLFKVFEQETEDRLSIRDLININDTLFFFVGSQGSGYELWTSDGTSDGTNQLYDNVGLSRDPIVYIDFDDTLIFRAGTYWRSDGTAEGTYPLVDPASDESYHADGYNAPQPVVVGDSFYFEASTESTGYELWKSDGTQAGTVLVKDIKLGQSDSYIRNFAKLDDKLYFLTEVPERYSLWTSDGTEKGTMFIKELPVTPYPWHNSYFSELINFNGAVYFIGAGETGYMLWKSDGTTEGTIPVREVYAFDYGSRARNLTTFGDKLVFGTYQRNYDSFKDGHLWMSDGTANGTSIIAVGSGDSDPSEFVDVNGTIFFAADDGIQGGEQLWKTDGTEAGTSLVAAVNELPIAGLSGFQNINGTLSLRVPNNGSYNLWTSDGTEAGTMPLLDPPEDKPYSVWPKNLLPLGDSYLFFNGSFDSNTSLWKTDGTKDGTSLVVDISGSSAVSTGERIFFIDCDDNGKELWTSDGTAAGTTLVKDIFPGERSSRIEQITNVNGTIFFTATDGVHGKELWKSDGTSEGTVMVKDIVPGPKHGKLVNFTNVDGTLYFQGADETNGYELWKSDGTSEGTILVKDINEGRNSSSPENLTNIDGILYFSAEDGIHGRELWMSDGTPNGTILVKDIWPGEVGSEPSEIVNGNGAVYLSADDGVNGRELWMSINANSTEGTIMVADIHIGEASAWPTRLYVAGDKLFFNATDREHGSELWALPLAPDVDGDGYAYGADNCPAIANADQLDSDQDGRGDLCDNDDDNDGTYDWLDAFVTDASETADSDGDGIGDNADTDPDTDLELIVMQEVFDAYFCFAGSVEKVSDTLYSFSCAGPAGHSTGAKIERFNDAETAKAEFVTLAGSTPLESLKCYTAYSWSDDSRPPIQSVYHSWLVDQWIVTSNTQDDTPHGFASASGTSFLVYQAAVGQGLIEGCIDTFFPMVAGE